MNSTNDLLMFQPSQMEGSKCPVEYIWNSLEKSSIDGYDKIYIDNCKGSFDDKMLESFGSTITPGKIVYFAHGDKYSNGFMAKNGIMDAAWWMKSEALVVAHSCYSAVILASPIWSEVFKDWLGSTDKVWYTIDEKGVNLWRTLFMRMSERFKSSNSCEALVEEIENIYFSALYDMADDEPDEGYRTAIERNKSILITKNMMHHDVQKS